MRYVIVLSIPLLLAVYFMAKTFMLQSRRRSFVNKPFPEEWRIILEETFPPYKYLTEALREKLHWYIHVFLDEKIFEGCGGLDVDDKIRVTIAANACLLLLGHHNRLYPRLETILVYPSTYVACNNGALDEPSVRLGESWQTGLVVLAWDSVKQGAINFHDGNNVTIHEFAHQLDQEDGSADGAPILERNISSYRTWAKVFNREYEVLRRKKRKLRSSVMDKYGATNPAEFFAVATESFFEKPVQMQRKHKELFEELYHYYGIDPREWIDA